MRRRAGFTLIELTVALSVSAILLTLVMRTFGDVRQHLSAAQAARTFEALHARARAHAIERGITTRLVIDANGDSASIVRQGSALETIHFSADLGVDVLVAAGSNPVVLCLNSRGYGDIDCASFSGEALIAFAAGPDTASVTMLPMGQLVR